MNIILNGYLGHMGIEVRKLVDASKDYNIVCGVDVFAKGEENVVSSFDQVNVDADCIIDFSNHTLTKDLVDFALAKKLPLIVATTGQTEEEKGYILDASKKIPVFFAANYSLGVALLIDLAKKTAQAFPNASIEIVETHHIRKVDAPSGTALAIAEGIKEVRPNAYVNAGRSGIAKRDVNEIGIASIRCGNIVGEHEVIVATDNQSIKLKHEAYSRALFAEGALDAAKYLVKKGPGLYTMKDMI